MAYLKDYERKCENGYCRKRAMVSLYTHRNEHWGDYCRRHGNEKLKWLKEREV